MSPMGPAFSANTVAVPDVPRRKIERSAFAGIEITAGYAPVPPIDPTRASVPDTAI